MNKLVIGLVVGLAIEIVAICDWVWYELTIPVS